MPMAMASDLPTCANDNSSQPWQPSRSTDTSMHGSRLKLLFVSLASLAMGGCGNVGGLPPRFDFQTPEPWIIGWLRAPVIAVGTISSLTPKGSALAEGPGQPIQVRLFELTVDIENVIRGDVRVRNIRVYRYGHELGQLPGHIPVQPFFPGERRVFCLLPEGVDYREVEDIVAGSFVVASGAHPQRDREKKSVLQQIAEVLLLPGVGFDEGHYARSIDVSTSSRVLPMVGYERTVGLLRNVMASTPATVAAEACLALYALHPFGDDCVQKLLHEASSPAAVRTKAMETVKLYGDGKRVELLTLKERPVIWFKSWLEKIQTTVYATATDKEDILFFLKEIAEGTRDPAVRRNARTLIEEHLFQL